MRGIVTAMGLTDAARLVATEQDGLITRAQLLGSGVTRETVRWRVGRDWRLVLPGVVLLHTGVPSEHERLVAALLFAGAGSWLSGVTAAALHGVRGCEVRAPVEVLVPAPRRPRTTVWVTVRSTSLLGERVVERGPLRISCPARAVVDAAAATRDDHLARAILLDACQRRLVRLDDLENWIALRGRPGSARLQRFLAEAAAGAWSVPEGDLLRIVAGSSVLPPVMANPFLRTVDGRTLTSPDLWFDDVGMAVMVHSRQFHAHGLDWDATVGAGSDLAVARVVVVGVTPGALARDPRRQLRRIEAAYAAARASGHRAAVVSTPRLTVPGLAPGAAPSRPA